VQEPRRPPFSVAAALRPPLDPVLALGELAVSFSTSLCFRFVFYCPQSTKRRTPARSGHGAAVTLPTPAGHSPLFPSICSGPFNRDPTVNIEGYPFGRAFCKRTPLLFKDLTCSPKRNFKNTFSDFEDVNSVLCSKYAFSKLQFYH